MDLPWFPLEGLSPWAGHVHVPALGQMGQKDSPLPASTGHSSTCVGRSVWDPLHPKPYPGPLAWGPGWNWTPQAQPSCPHPGLSKLPRFTQDLPFYLPAGFGASSGAGGLMPSVCPSWRAPTVLVRLWSDRSRSHQRPVSVMDPCWAQW